MTVKPLSKDERFEIQKLLKTKLDEKLKQLDADDPGWQKRVEDQKNKIAIGRLRIEKDFVELKELETEITLLTQKHAEIELRIRKKLPLEERGRYGGCSTNKDMCDSISEICSEVHNSVMKKDQTGKLALKVTEDYNQMLALFYTCTTREDVVYRNILGTE